MDYREFPPSPALAPYIHCYWTLEAAAGEGGANRIFPDGSMEMIFHLGDPFQRVFANHAERQPSTLLVGQTLSPVVVAPEARADVIGIRFRPGGAYPFLRFPQQEVACQILSLEDVLGSGVRRLRDRLGGIASPESRVALVERFLLDRRPQPLEPLPNLSPRQFRRRFEQRVGIPPKLFARIRRFQRVLALLQQGPMAGAAVAAGYHDQPHLVRDFKQFAGTTPSEWLRTREDVLFV